MNPLTWPGPAFLIFYLASGVALLALLVFWRRSAESGDAPRVRLSDPYLIASLRGGPPEALRLAVVALLDRGLLKVSGTCLQAEPGASALVRREVEKAVLERFGEPDEAATVYNDAAALRAAEALDRELRRLGLLPGERQLWQRHGRTLLGIGLLAALAALKLAVALARGRHNVGFLVALAVLLSLAALATWGSRRTARGDALLASLRTLFGGLRARSAGVRRGGATAELSLLMAVFGLAALPAPARDEASALFPKARASTSASSSCGTSCGSSCGSSGGDGGGGCGGCGGCGGGD